MCNELFGEAYRPGTTDNEFFGFLPVLEAVPQPDTARTASPPANLVTSFYTGDMEQESLEPDCDGY